MFWQLLILQVGFFVVLLLVLNKLFHGQLINAIGRMEKLREHNLKKEEELKVKEELVVKDCQERIRKTDQEIALLRMNAEEEAKQLKQNALSHFEEEKKNILSELREKEKVLQNAFERRAQKKASEIALHMVQKALGEGLVKTLHEKLTQELLESMDKQDAGTIRESSLHNIRVVSAFPLTEDQKKNLKNKIFGRGAVSAPKGGETPPLQCEIDASLVAGFIVHLGQLVLDGSLKNRFEKYLGLENHE